MIALCEPIELAVNIITIIMLAITRLVNKVVANDQELYGHLYTVGLPLIWPPLGHVLINEVD